MNGKFRRLAAAVVATVGVLIATNSYAALSIDTLSSRPDLVGGTSALVVIRGAATSPRVVWDPSSAGNRDISKFFSQDPAVPGQWIGLISGFTEGKNKDIIEVTV